jgi:hypothetical protein
MIDRLSVAVVAGAAAEPVQRFPASSPGLPGRLGRSAVTHLDSQIARDDGSVRTLAPGVLTPGVLLEGAMRDA